MRNVKHYLLTLALVLWAASVFAQEHVRILPEEIEFKPNPSWHAGPSGMNYGNPSDDPRKK